MPEGRRGTPGSSDRAGGPKRQGGGDGTRAAGDAGLRPLMHLAREVPGLEAEEARRRLRELLPEQRALVLRIALALGLPWELDGPL